MKANTKGEHKYARIIFLTYAVEHMIFYSLQSIIIILCKLYN